MHQFIKRSKMLDLHCAPPKFGVGDRNAMRTMYYFSWSHENTKHPMAQPLRNASTRKDKVLRILDTATSIKTQPFHSHHILILSSR